MIFTTSCTNDLSYLTNKGWFEWEQGCITHKVSNSSLESVKNAIVRKKITRTDKVGYT